MTTYETNDPQETQELGKKLAQTMSAGNCVALIGDLGAGKTAFVRGLAEGLGADPQMVSSPTYVLMQEYPGPLPLYHLDLYRMIDAEAEFIDLAPEEMLAEGVLVIEWADKATSVLPHPHTEISIEITGATSRKFTVETKNA